MSRSKTPSVLTYQPLIGRKYDFYIGIDCGVETGLAIWDKKARSFIRVESMMIHQAMDQVLKFCSAQLGNVLIRVEDARQRKWIPRQKSESAERGRREGAGSVKRDAQIWEDFLRDHNLVFEMVPPKKNKTKVKSGYFEQVSGWKGRTNEHARDAGMLVFGY